MTLQEFHRSSSEPTRVSMGRRSLLAGSAVAVLAGPGCATRSPYVAAGRPIVLVHGAWHGGWCWQRVTPLLTGAGHRVFTPTLTGLGDRAHLARPDIDVELHARDLQALFEMEDLRDVVLVGHSYAGMPMSLLAERLPERLAGLVYFDAFVPESGKRVIDYIQPPERREALLKSGRETGFAAPVPLQALGVVDAADLEWAQPRIVPQPFASFERPIQLKSPAGNGLPRIFIACTKPASGSFGQFAATVRNAPGWRLHELESGHDAMIIDPPRVAELLLAIAREF